MNLTDLAFARLTEQLTSYGSVLAAAHREALYCVVGRFLHLANNYLQGLGEYDLLSGTGKTEAAKTCCWALWKLKKPYFVAISSSKVEVLCELKRGGLIALGVPESAIGLIHSYIHKPGVVTECLAKSASAGLDLAGEGNSELMSPTCGAKAHRLFAENQSDDETNFSAGGVQRVQ